MIDHTFSHEKQVIQVIIKRKKIIHKKIGDLKDQGKLRTSYMIETVLEEKLTNYEVKNEVMREMRVEII